MKTKRVNRYYCDFCKKSGCSKFHLQRHEESYTLNPNRICRLCDLIDGDDRTPLAELIAMLPDVSLFTTGEYGMYGDDLRDAVNAVLPAMRKSCNYCPICIMAALRQSGIPVNVATDFEYDKERKSVWEDINDRLYSR